MRICIISGSARQNNNTYRTALALQRVLQAQHVVKIIDFTAYDIPLIAQGGIDLKALTPFQQNLFNTMAESHVVIVISPEYNWSTTPEILNLMHLLPTKEMPELLNNKVFAFAGVSTGKGGKIPAIQLMQITNKLISFGNFKSIVSAKIFESHFTNEALDENGNSLGNNMYDNGMIDFCNYTIAVADRWFK
jgi:chromate reductase